MAVELAWRFGDEVPDEAPPEEHPPRRPRWRVWLGLGGVALLLAGLGFYGWWRVRHEALAAVEAEVRAVAQVELRALAEGDMELYVNLQDDADPAWRQVQEARAMLGAPLPPPLPGLTATTVLSVENARVVGDVARVEVVRTAGLPDGEMAPFRAVRFYRRSDDGRWLHTRADLDYAGHTVVFAGRRVEVTVFATDEGWVQPVAPKLEALGDQFCSLVSCQHGAPLILDLTSTLDDVVEPEGVLPAPFLVGVPEDEAARAAWEAGLSGFLLDRLVAREVGQPVSSVRGRPHGGELFRARLREWLRAKLGLCARVSPNLDFIGETLDAGMWVSLEALWDFTPADDDPRRPLAEAEIDLLLAFIEEEYGPSRVAGLLHTLRESRSMGTLIGGALGEDWPVFKYPYAVYVHEVARRPSEHPGEVAAFAEYDLVTICEGPSNLWGLRLDRLEMTPLFAAAGFDYISWSPDGSRLLAWWDVTHGGGFYLLEANGSGAHPLTGIPEGAEPAGWLPGGSSGWSPDSSRVAYSMPGPSPGGGVVDVGTGESVTLDGQFLVWSPDGSYLTYVTSGGAVPLVWLAEGDGSNPRRVGEGFSIAWAPDGTRIAFFSAGPALEVYDVAAGETQTVLDGPALYGLLDVSPEFENVLVQANSLAWSPTGEWIGLGVDQFGETGTTGGMEFVKGGVALVHPDGGALRVPFTREAGIYVTGWSPDGRWLTGYVDGGDAFTATVIGIDGMPLLETSGWISSWSPGGRYLAVVEVDGVRVLEVESGTWHSFEPTARCGPVVVWNPRGPLHEPTPDTMYTTPRPRSWLDVDQCDLPRCQH